LTYRHSGAGMTPQKCPFLLTPCLFLRRQESREAQPVVLSHCAPPESPPHPCRGTACRARDPWLRGVLPTPRGGESSQRNPRGGGQPPFLCPRKELPRLRHSGESRLCVCQVCDLTWSVIRLIWLSYFVVMVLTVMTDSPLPSVHSRLPRLLLRKPTL